MAAAATPLSLYVSLFLVLAAVLLISLCFVSPAAAAAAAARTFIVTTISAWSSARPKCSSSSSSLLIIGGQASFKTRLFLELRRLNLATKKRQEKIEIEDRSRVEAQEAGLPSTCLSVKPNYYNVSQNLQIVDIPSSLTQTELKNLECITSSKIKAICVCFLDDSINNVHEVRQKVSTNLNASILRLLEIATIYGKSFKNVPKYLISSKNDIGSDGSTTQQQSLEDLKKHITLTAKSILLENNDILMNFEEHAFDVSDLVANMSRLSSDFSNEIPDVSSKLLHLIN